MCCLATSLAYAQLLTSEGNSTFSVPAGLTSLTVLTSLNQTNHDDGLINVTFDCHRSHRFVFVK